MSTDEFYDDDDSIIKGLHLGREGGEADFWDKLPQGYLSVSQVEQYLKCGEAYRQRYILGKPFVSNNFIVQGRCVHYAAEQFNLNLIHKKKPLETEETVQYFVDKHNRELNDGQDLELLDVPSWDAVKDEGIGLIKMYRAGAMGDLRDGKTGETLATIKPIAAEKALRVVLEPRDSSPVPFVGIVDIVEEESLSDIKVKNKQAPQNETDNSIQLTIYSHILGKPTVRLEQLVKKSKTKSPRYVRTTAVRSAKEARHAVDIIGDVATNIAEGRFPRTHPNNWWCTKKWCKFWDDCRGRKL